MEDLKVITASNIINLRTAAGMTQAELGEKLGYSDKSVSKWERAEGIPDVYVIKNLSAIFGVTADYILSEHDEWKAVVKKESAFHTKIATTIALSSIWTIALLIFVIMWLSKGSLLWGVFIIAIPVSLITLLVLNSVWEKGKNNYYIIASLVFSIIAAVYFLFYKRNWWPLFLLLVPAELIVVLSAHVKKKKSGESR